MTKSARIFAWCIAAAGAVTLLAAAILWPAANPDLFLACLALALAGATVKVQLPRMEGTSSPSFIPIVFAVVQCPWQQTMVIAASAAIVQTFWKAGRRPSAIQIAFNAANFVLSAAVAGAVAASAPSGSSLRFVVAAVALQVLMTWNVALIVALIHRTHPDQIWKQCQMWSFPYHLSGGLLAAACAQAGSTASFTLGFLALITIYLTGAFYREMVLRSGHRAPASN